MMSEEYSKLKEEAQHRETWNHWRSEPARRRSHRKFQKITTQQQWYRRRADKLSAAVGGGAHKLSAAAARPAHGSTCNMFCGLIRITSLLTQLNLSAWAI